MSSPTRISFLVRHLGVDNSNADPVVAGEGGGDVTHLPVNDISITDDTNVPDYDMTEDVVNHGVADVESNEPDHIPNDVMLDEVAGVPGDDVVDNVPYMVVDSIDDDTNEPPQTPTVSQEFDNISGKLAKKPRKPAAKPKSGRVSRKTSSAIVTAEAYVKALSEAQLKPKPKSKLKEKSFKGKTPKRSTRPTAVRHGNSSSGIVDMVGIAGPSGTQKSAKSGRASWDDPDNICAFCGGNFYEDDKGEGGVDQVPRL